MNIKSYVIEQQHIDRPIAISKAKQIFWSVVVICFVGFFTIIYSEFKINSKYTPLEISLGLSLKIFIHSAYLFLVFYLLIFSQPIDNIYWQKITLPLLLCVAYLFYALSVGDFSGSYCYNCLFNKLAYLAFAIMYLVWGLRDYYELKKSNKSEKFAWFVIELLSIVFLLTGIIFSSTIDKYLEHIVSIKDITVVCSLVVYFVVRMGTVYGRKDNYVSIYSTYLNYIHPRNSTVIHQVDVDKKWNILDFGCGSGKRLDEATKMLGLNSKDIDSVTGYDIINGWERKFSDKMDQIGLGNVSRFSASFDDLNMDVLSETNLLIISHVLYSTTAFDDLSKTIEKLKPECLILIRGNAPLSWFYLYSYVKNTNWLNRINNGHSWMNWVDELKGRDLITCTASPITFEQDFNITTREGRDSLEAFLQNIYNDSTSNFTCEYLTDLYNRHGIQTIPCHDLVVLCKRK